MSVEVRFFAENTEDLTKQIEAFIGTTTTTVTGDTTPVKDEPPKPARRSRKAAPKKDKAKKEPTLSYEKDVKPVLVKLANARDQGKAKAVEIVRSFGVAKGDMIPDDKLQEALDLAKKAIEGMSEDDDDEF